MWSALPDEKGRGFLPWLLAALVLAAILRLMAWPAVFAGEGIYFLADGDTYYHVLRARQLAIDHQLPWCDPGLNHPFGAKVLWPPLFDILIAAAAWLVSGGTPSVRTVEICAAVLPALLGIAGVAAGAWLAVELIGRRGAILVAFLLAVLPNHVLYSAIGRSDHHVLESLLLSLLLIVFLGGLKAKAEAGLLWRYPLGLGVVMAASLWTWVGSSFHLVVLCLMLAAVCLLPGQQDDSDLRGIKVVGAGSAFASLILAVATYLLGPADALRQVSLQGISLFHVLMTAAVALWGLLLLLARRLPVAAGGLPRRLIEIAGATLVTVAIFWLASAELREAVQRGLLALTRGNEWYRFIREFYPLIFSPSIPLADELKLIWAHWGLLPLLVAFGVVELVADRWPLREERLRLLVLTVFGAVFTALLIYMMRFAYYSVVPLAIFAALGVMRLARTGAARLPESAAAALLVAAAVAPCLPQLLPSAYSSARAQQLDYVLSPIGEGLLSREGGILAPWDSGHHARYYAGLPVVASPFGTDGGEGAMEDTAAFFLATDEQVAEQLLNRRRIRYVLMEYHPGNAVAEAVAILKPAVPPIQVLGDRYQGYTLQLGAGFNRLIMARLYLELGMATPAHEAALGGFRLVSEVGPRGGIPAWRLFEVVTGARVRVTGARPGAKVTARSQLTTPLGTLPWEASAVADPDGAVGLRLPYATDLPGRVTAAPYLVGDGVRTARLAVPNRAVEDGAVIELRLDGH